MVAIFVGFIDSKQKFTKAHSKYPKLRSEFNGLLRAFNMKKAEKLLNLPEFSKLVGSFFSEEDFMGKIIGEDSHPQVVEAYQKKIGELKTLLK